MGHTPAVTLRRRGNRLFALTAALAIVVAQSASLAYACTRAPAAMVAAVAATPCPEHQPALDGRPGASMDNLCEVHCQAASLPPPALAVMAPPPALAVAVVAPQALEDGEPASAPIARSSGPPPRYRYCRLQL